jgi:hypothetical protein
MIPIIKYPRTPHISGSRLQSGDEDLPVIAVDDLESSDLIIEEKLDGSNSAISFDPDGALILQSRGHVLTGGPRERQFDLLKRWANHYTAALWKILGHRFILYGEWLYAKHTIPYDELPHYFLEFDILDRESWAFLSTDARRGVLAGGPVVSVPVLGRGSARNIERYLGRSCFSSSQQMEGLYLKEEEGDRVVARYKFVRPEFLQTVEESGSHWADRPIEPNHLRAGVDLFA